MSIAPIGRRPQQLIARYFALGGAMRALTGMG